MGKGLKIFGGVVVALGAAAYAIPAFFSSDVAAFAKNMANDYVKNCTIDFDDYSLSIFSSFPDLTAGFDDINIIGTDRFEGDTLLHVGSLRVNLDILSAIKGEIVVNGVLIDDVLANAIVTADSIANWDVVADSDDTEEETEEETDDSSTSLQVNLEELAITNVRLSYNDSTSQISASIDGLNLNLAGTMDGNIFGMDMTLTIDAINAILEGTRYVSDATLAFDCKATADLDSMKFTFDENKLTFAGLPLAFDGYVQLCDSSTAMDLKLAALETSFKTILDLVPDEMLADVEGLQTSGSLCLYAKATGEFVDMDNIPALDAVLLIKDGYAQYPDLPKSLNDINVSVVVNNPGGSADLTTVAVDTFHIELGGNPFDITAHVSKPISNPNFDFSMVGTLDLGSLKDALPLDSISIAGVLTANLTVASDLASIEAEKYDQVNANGTVGLTNFSFANADIPNGVTISKALLTFTPKVVNLNPLAVALGSSDFSLTGNVQNYLAYVLSDGTVTGSATLTSSLIDCNELLALAGDSEETADEVAEEEASESSDAIEIPTNINFAFTTSINKLVYDNLEMTNVAGAVTLKDGIATLSNLSMNACDGKFALNGSFQTPKNANSKANMKIDMTNVSLVKLMSSFDVIDSLMPIAKSATGNITLGLAVTTEMDSELSPVLNTVNGTASFSSSSISLKDSEFQTKLANLLSNDSYTDLTLKDLKIKGTITDGNITITPFTLALLGKTATFSGSQNLDQSMAYNLSVPVSRSEISTLISKAGINVSSFSTSGSDINVGVNIGGTLTSPELSLDSDGIISALKSEVTTAVVETASEVADNLIESIQNETVKEAVSNVKSTITNLLKK